MQHRHETQQTQSMDLISFKSHIQDVIKPTNQLANLLWV